MKKQLKIVACIILFMFCIQNVFALNTDAVLRDPGYDPTQAINGIATKTKNIWATVAVLVQIASVACVVFAGLRYMFASSDQKADIKQGLTYLFIGAILVFCSTLVIQLIANATEEIL